MITDFRDTDRCLALYFIATMADFLLLSEELAAMPKASLCTKTVHGRQYQVVQYREGKNVHSHLYHGEDIPLGDPVRRRYLRASISQIKELFRRSRSLLKYYGLTREALEAQAREWIAGVGRMENFEGEGGVYCE